MKIEETMKYVTITLTEADLNGLKLHTHDEIELTIGGGNAMFTFKKIPPEQLDDLCHEWMEHKRWQAKKAREAEQKAKELTTTSA